MISITPPEGECERNNLNLRKIGVIPFNKGISLVFVSSSVLFPIPLRIS